jgi:hypothetical protein
MKRANNTYKSQKLVRIFLKYDEVNNTIQSISITGDFFIHPEENLDKLEADLIGTRLVRNSITNVIDKSLKDSEIFGFNSESMADAILGCLNK